MAKRFTQKVFDGFDEEADSPGADSHPQPPSGADAPASEYCPHLPAAGGESDQAGHGVVDAAHMMDDLSGKSVYVIDAHSLIFQVYHAMPEMTGPAGQPVNAIYGFLRDILQLVRNQSPDYMFCAFDLPGKTFRHQLYEAYKADRAEMPEDLVPQIAQIQRLLDALEIPVLASEGFEADDVLGTMAAVVERLHGQCILVTNDKDCRQLITDHVRLFNIRKNEFLDAQSLLNEWGIRPDQVVDYQALVGDPIDNVPGIPLIGPKLAQQLLTQYGSLESILDHAGEISGTKRRESVHQHRQQVLKSRELVRLARDVPLQVDWTMGQVRLLEPARALKLCEEFGFRSLADQIVQWAGGPGPSSSTTSWQAHYQTLTRPEQLAELAGRLRSAGQFALDTETTGLDPRQARLVGMSICWAPGEAAYIPVRAPQADVIADWDVVVQTLQPVLEDPAIAKMGQNIKYDAVVLWTAGIQLRGISFDSMVASFLLDSGARSHGLDYLASRYLQHSTIKIQQLIGTGRNQKRMDEVAVEAVTTYACEDADVAYRLATVMSPLLSEGELMDLLAGIEVPLIEVLARMEFVGIRLDAELLQRLSQEYGRRLAELETAIYDLAGHEFNIASPRQLATVLFEELKLPVVKKTKTGNSTDVEVLEQLAPQHELPRAIIKHRHLAKLKSTYIDALPAMINPETGRIHTSFNQVVAVTGRLSSAEPNLQNIPIRTSEGREIRAAFIPEPGWRLVMADYSQIELRVLAHFSGDASLLDSFQRDEDIHARVAAEVFHVPLNEVSSEQRRRAKAVNFGVIYGQSAFGLAKALGIAKDEAAAFIDAYFERYQGILAFMEQILDECQQRRFVTTMFGRRRRIEGVRPAAQRSARQRNLPERTAINSVIQGTAADLIKKAMIGIHHRISREGWRSQMLLQIHDELLFEVPPEEEAAFVELVREEMEQVASLKVPLRVDIQVGASWAEGK